MRIELATPEDRPAALTPWRVISVRVLADFQLDVEFSDRTFGRVDLRQLIMRNDAGVFAALRDRAVFASARVEHGAVCWPGDIDLAPDAMYHAIRRTGAWQPT